MVEKLSLEKDRKQRLSLMSPDDTSAPAPQLPDVSDAVTPAREMSEPVVMRAVCRFFTKGHCRWGSSCRYLHHPSVLEKVIMLYKSVITIATVCHSSFYPSVCR